MKDDPLERAASIVRERFDGRSPRASVTEARLLAALNQRSRHQHWWLLVAVPLLVALLASAAWGNLGGHVRAAWRALSGAQLEPDPTSRVSKPTLTPKFSPPAPLEPASVPTEPASVPTPASPSAEAPPQRALRTPLARSPVKVSAAELSDLYRAAHEAQFSAQDWARALELWNRYLAAAPNGALSPEARYNRAIDLLHLGRELEASQALETFARGDYGPYRQNEARALLKARRSSDDAAPTP